MVKEMILECWRIRRQGKCYFDTFQDDVINNIIMICELPIRTILMKNVAFYSYLKEFKDHNKNLKEEQPLCDPSLILIMSVMFVIRLSAMRKNIL